MSNADQPPVVLIADDDRGLCRLIERVLHRARFSTGTALSGAAALAWLAEKPADLLLLDLKLPDMDGRDLVAKLSERGHTVPFIIITGQGDERMAVEMMKRGALDYLVKDVQFIEFVPAVVQRALAQVEREKRLLETERERRRLEQEILKVSESEQRRIGQDLHDGICQILAGIDMLTRVLQKKLEQHSPAEAADAETISKYARKALAQTRLLSRGLSPVEVETNGLMAALRELADHTKQLFNIDCVFRCTHPVLLQDNAKATHLYRIAQEAINNSVKHAKAHRIEIRLERLQDETRLRVTDDGVGFFQEMRQGDGMGLQTMRYRAATIGAKLEILPREPHGTVVLCAWGDS